MAYYDRHYYRDEMRSSPMTRFTSHSVVAWLLIINVVVFLLDSILLHSRRGAMLAPVAWGNFNIDQAIYSFQIWRLVTYQFLHADLLHLIFNMIPLYFFGPLLENWWGSRRFLWFYLLCGMSGAVVFTLLAYVPGLLNVSAHSPLVGASGAIYGLLVGAAVLYPNAQVSLLLLPIAMRLRTLVMFFMAIVFLSLIAGSRNAGGEAAHLGGAVLGFLLVKRPRWLGGFDRLQRFSPDQLRQKWKRHSHERQQRRQRELDAEVDRILAKVNREGIQSLSRREKRTLQEATESKRRG